MENSILFMILLQVFLILLNAVFASAEIAVISINDAKLARMAAEGDKRAVRLARLTSSWQPFKLPSPCPAFWAVPLRRRTFQTAWSIGW